MKKLAFLAILVFLLITGCKDNDTVVGPYMKVVMNNSVNLINTDWIKVYDNNLRDSVYEQIKNLSYFNTLKPGDYDFIQIIAPYETGTNLLPFYFYYYGSQYYIDYLYNPNTHEVTFRLKGNNVPINYPSSFNIYFYKEQY